MKILLIGNYPHLKSQSMDRFASILDTGLKDFGFQVQLLKPKPLLGRIFPSAMGLGKWLGYVDRFLIFLPFLKKNAKWADVVHICDQANAVYVPWLKNKPHVVTCHDMIAIRSAIGEISDYKISLIGRLYQRWILAGLKRALHVACVSTTTHDDLLRLTRIDVKRVSIVRNGLNYPYRRISMRESLYHLEQIGFGNYRPYFLHVGGNYWYKNKVGLLRIFAQLLSHGEYQQTELVIVGEDLSLQLRLVAQNLGISERIREIPNVTNEQLCALYSSAEGLIFPSLIEGFGWPIIEAQACGCPVFTSKRRPMTEIGGYGAVYFDPIDEAGAARIIYKALQDKEILQERGYRNVMRYSISTMISNYIRTYRFVTN